MKIRLFGFAVLLTINICVIYSLWDTLLISILPICLILLSVFCSGLFLVNVKSKVQRAITYFLTIIILLIGLFFAIHYRRPLGFLVAFSSATVIIKNFICGANSKEKLATKIIGVILLLAISLTIVFTGLTFSYVNKALVNGTGILWGIHHEKRFDTICATATSDEEKAKLAYTWILNNITYDYDCNPAYQYSNLDKTLQTKKVSVMIFQVCLRLSAAVRISLVIPLTDTSRLIMNASTLGIEFVLMVCGMRWI